MGPTVVAVGAGNHGWAYADALERLGGRADRARVGCQQPEGDCHGGKFGLDPHRLDDQALERELHYLYATREETSSTARARRS
jgi:hypothetical protein